MCTDELLLFAGTSDGVVSCYGVSGDEGSVAALGSVVEEADGVHVSCVQVSSIASRLAVACTKNAAVFVVVVQVIDGRLEMCDQRYAMFNSLHIIGDSV